MSLKWATTRCLEGRVAGSVTALQKRGALVCDTLMSAPQTLHITLFVDGTNNNDLPPIHSATRLITHIETLLEVGQLLGSVERGQLLMAYCVGAIER